MKMRRATIFLKLISSLESDDYREEKIADPEGDDDITHLDYCISMFMFLNSFYIF